MNGIFQSVSGFDIIRHKEIVKDDIFRRIQASFAHPNDFGAYIISVLPLSFCLLSKGLRRRDRLFLAAVCMLGVYCLFKTSSRSAWVGFASGLFLYFFFYKRKFAILMPVAALMLVAIAPHVLERVTSLFKMEQNTVWERTQLWKGTWEMVKVHPFLGFGINTFSRYFPSFKPSEYWGIMYTHNSYLQMWSEIGFIGLAAFLSVIAAAFAAVFRRMKDKLARGFEGLVLLGLACGYTAFMIQSAFDTNLFSLSLMTLFWVMTAYMISLNAYLESRKDA
jgi:O-antigen ligase